MHLDLASIKAAAPVPVLFERDGHVLKRAGDHQVCLCPFHKERTPSCHVWEDHFHCFSCSTRGDCFTYIAKTRSVTFKEALRILSDGHVTHASFIRSEAPRKREEPKSAVDFASLAADWSSRTSEDQMNDLAAKIGVSAEALWWMGVGWAQDYRAWSFPMCDGNGKVIGIRLRRGEDKFAVKASKQGVFFARLPTHDRALLVTEGPTDCAAALSLGFFAAGRPSCHGCTDFIKHICWRHSIREVVIVADNDDPGIKGAKELRAALKVPSRLLVLPPKDLRRFVQIGGGRALLNKMISNQQLLRP